MRNEESRYQVPQWFCVHTKPSHEIQAVSTLKNLTEEVQQNVGEIEVYFPRIWAKMAVGGHLRKVLKPLFPRYFFSKVIWEKAARFIASRPQVIGFVQFSDYPAIVPEKVIEEMIAWSLEDDREVFDPTTEFNPGQRVLIKSGPFKGMEAEFVSHLNDHKRVALLMDHLQSQPRLILERAHLKLAT